MNLIYDNCLLNYWNHMVHTRIVIKLVP